MNPLVLTDDGKAVKGDNTGKPNNTSGCVGVISGEDVYEVVASMDGVMKLTLTPQTQKDLVVYARTNCDDAASEIGCFNNGVMGEVESGTVPVKKGTHYFVFVDGVGGDEGPYTLTAQTIDIGPVCMMAGALGPANMGDTTNTVDDFKGSCESGGANEQLFQYKFPSDGALSLALNATADMGLYAQKVCGDPATELACSDQQGGGTAEGLDVIGVAGDVVTIFVDGYTAGDNGPFTLDTALTALTEKEPNDDYTTAQGLGNSNVFSINPAGDNDWFSVAANAGQTISVDVQALAPTDCLDNHVDSYVEVVDTDGMTVLDSNDDNATSYCSTLANVPAAKAGTYFVHVSASPLSPNKTFAYKLVVTVQ